MVIHWACLLCLVGGIAAADPPRRVLSMNLCTDQLALMLAAPGQLISLSHLARDPRMSVMAAQAQDLTVNHGLAEEIFLMQPDLVLAGSFSAPATLDLLRRLGIRVEVFAPEGDIGAIRDNMRRMGRVLEREAAAQATIDHFDADLEDMAANGPRLRAARYSANGYSAGTSSLSGRIIELANLHNIAADVGLNVGGTLPLEVLMMSAPDLVIRDKPSVAPSRAEEVLDHPGLRSFSQTMTNADWVCGTPYVLRAATTLREAAG